MLLRRQVVKKSNIAKAIALRTQEVRTVAGMGNKEGSWEVTKYSVLAARKQRGYMAVREAT